MKRFAGVVLLGLFACEGKVGVSVLIKTTDEATSAKCPAGGVLIETGPDSDRNRVLDAAEVTQTSEVCAGTAGTNGMNGMGGTVPLVETATLPQGDTHCPGGGTRIDVGSDDGKGGGMAGDGVLQAGEISSTRYVCNGAFPYYPGSTTPPAGPAGQYQIVTKAGTAASGQTGYGGGVTLKMPTGSLGGHVKVFSTGVADAGFTVPTMVPFAAGSAPMTVTTDVTVHAYASVADGMNSMNPFFRVGGRLYTAAGAQVTSVNVAATKTLTLENPNDDDLVFVNDFRNLGTVKTVVAASGTPVRLQLTANRFVSEPGSHLVADGANNSTMGATGSQGGVVDVTASALLLNWGDISAKGGIADTAGQGGSIELHAWYGPLYNLGTLDASGGLGNVTGGLGGYVKLYAEGTEVFNSGDLNAVGGGGMAQSGNGGLVYFGDAASGPIRNSGNLTARAGACQPGGNCQGGTGGHVTLFAAAGELVSSGAIDTSGASGSGTGPGGSGGNIDVRSAEHEGLANIGVVAPCGSIVLSGNLVSTGGSGEAAGAGGSILVTLEPNTLPQGQELTLLGYTKIDTSGGSSTNNNGGEAGSVEVLNNGSYWHDVAASSGGAFLYADVVAKGGDGYLGGFGGSIVVQGQADWDFGLLENESVGVFSSSIDFSGGAGNSYGGGFGGSLRVYGVGHVENHAKITGLGGSVSGGPAQGGRGGRFDMGSEDGAVVNTGDVDLSAGSSSGVALGGGSLELTGVSCTTSGALKAKGGNAAAGAGGKGGYIALRATGGGATVSTSTFDVSPGSGATPGAKGNVLIDGVDVTP